MEDPRVEGRKRHKLIDILTIAICAVICGAHSWVVIELYGCIKYEWLKTFLELGNGLRSQDTFGRVFAQTIESATISKLFLELDEIST